MNKILIPVNGSVNSDLAVKYAFETYGGETAQAHFYLFNIQPTIHRHIRKFLTKQILNDWNMEQSKLASTSAVQFLEKLNCQFSLSYACGNKGVAILKEAKRLGCSRIVLGTSKKNMIHRLFVSSTTNQLLETSDLPIEIVTGKVLHPIKRFGIPAVGVGAATALLAMID